MTDATRKILLVEDDDLFRTKFQSSLEALGYTVVSTDNGKMGKNLMGVDLFDLVITDIRLQDISGLELLHHIKKNHSETPVILMTGFPEFKDPQEAIDVGASAFLQKPFKKETLLAAIAISLKDRVPIAKKTEPQDNSDINFCKLDINDFISGNQLQYDIYIRISEDRFIKIARHGEPLSAERVNNYKAKDTKYLYMRKEDFKKYVGFSVNLTKLIRTSSKIDQTKKMHFLKHATDVVMGQLQLEGVNKENYENAKTVTESTMSIMAEGNDMMAVMEMLSKHTNFLYSHSMGVSIHATMIGKEIGWKSPLILFKLSMGGLLHDVGKKEIPEELLMKGRTELTPAEIKLLESHTIRGADILNGLHNIPTDVVQIASQHHENCLGLGYPAAIKGKLIHPLARVVSVANEFCDLTIKSPHNPVAMNPKAAIQKMAATINETLDPIFFAALAKIYDVKLADDNSEDGQKRKKKFENIK